MSILQVVKYPPRPENTVQEYKRKKRNSPPSAAGSHSYINISGPEMKGWVGSASVLINGRIWKTDRRTIGVEDSF